MKTFILFLAFLLVANIAHAQYTVYGEVDNTQNATDCVSLKDGYDGSPARNPAYIFTNSCSKPVIFSRTDIKERHLFITKRLEREFGIKNKKEWPFQLAFGPLPLKPGAKRVTTDHKHAVDRDIEWAACFAPWTPHNISTKKHTIGGWQVHFASGEHVDYSMTLLGNAIRIINSPKRESILMACSHLLKNA